MPSDIASIDLGVDKPSQKTAFLSANLDKVQPGDKQKHFN
jgi:hypothetical protein